MKIFDMFRKPTAGVLAKTHLADAERDLLLAEHDLEMLQGTVDFLRARVERLYRRVDELVGPEPQEEKVKFWSWGIRPSDYTEYLRPAPQNTFTEMHVNTTTEEENAK